MPLSPRWCVAGQSYCGWNCCQNRFAELTLIYASCNASLDIQNVVYAVQYNFWASERRLPATRLQTRVCGWGNPSWTASCISKWYHESLSTPDSQRSSYQLYSRLWLQSQDRINVPKIQHACRQSCLQPHEALLRQQSSFEQVCGKCSSGTSCLSPKFLQ